MEICKEKSQKNILKMLEDKGKLDKVLGYYEESLRLMTDKKQRQSLTNILLLSMKKRRLSKGSGISSKGDRIS